MEAIRPHQGRNARVFTDARVSTVSFGSNPAARHALNSVFPANECLQPASIGQLLRQYHALSAHARLATPSLSRPRVRPTWRRGGDTRTRFTTLWQKLSRGCSPIVTVCSVYQRISHRIGRSTAPRREIVPKGDREGLEADLAAAMRGGLPPLADNQQPLAPGIKTVGELFAPGEMQFAVRVAICRIL